MKRAIIWGGVGAVAGYVSGAYLSYTTLSHGVWFVGFLAAGITFGKVRESFAHRKENNSM